MTLFRRIFLLILVFHLIWQKIYIYIYTCDAKDNTAERNPGGFSIPLEVINDVFRVDRLDDQRVVFDEVVHANAGDEEEPNGDDRSEGVADLVGAEPLSQEEADQDADGYHHNPV